MLKNKSLIKILAIFSFMVVAIGGYVTVTAPINPITISAEVGSSGSSGTLDASQERLREAVDNAVSGNTYTSDTGVTYKGSQLVSNGIVTSLFSELSSESQNQLISDMNAAVDAQIAKDASNTSQSNPVVSGTKQSWVQTLLAQPGVVASTFAFLENDLSADLVSANQFFSPLYPFISFFLGVALVLVFLSLFLSFGIDIAAMFIPFFRQKVMASGTSGAKSHGGGGQLVNGIKNRGNGAGLANWVSQEAINAIRKSEEDGSGTGGTVLVFFKQRVFGLFIFVLYVAVIASGNIFTVMGSIIDVVASMLGM